MNPIIHFFHCKCYIFEKWSGPAYRIFEYYILHTVHCVLWSIRLEYNLGRFKKSHPTQKYDFSTACPLTHSSNTVDIMPVKGEKWKKRQNIILGKIVLHWFEIVAKASASMNLFFWLLLLDHFWSWLHVHSENLLYSQFSKQFRSWEISKQNSWHNTKSADSWRWIKLHVLKRFNFLENVVILMKQMWFRF